MADAVSKLVRVGECNMCGECCRKLGWLCVYAPDDTPEWIQARDSRIEINPDPDVPDYYHVSIPYTCQHLSEIDPGRFICKLHDTKPSTCRAYPEPSDKLKPGCGFKFVVAE